MTEDRKAIRVSVRGRVQGVGFRAFTVAAATPLGIAGWVRNAGDGTVEVFAQGSPGALADFEELLSRGPRFARVEGMEVSESMPEEGCDRFRVRPSDDGD